MRKKFVVHIGAGTWDSWGFQVAYCHPERSLFINIIHWYFYVEVTTLESHY